MDVDKYRYKYQQQRLVYIEYYATCQQRKVCRYNYQFLQFLFEFQRRQKDDIQFQIILYQSRFLFRCLYFRMVLYRFFREIILVQEQERQYYCVSQRCYLGNKFGKRKIRTFLDKNILRVVNWRQQRISVDCQRFKNNQSINRDFIQFFQRDSQRNNNKQRDIVGQKGRKQRRRQYYKYRQSTFRSKAAYYFAFQYIKIIV